MGLRRSRWAKSTMVAGVLAVVLSYAAPPISAAAAAGSAVNGLPGLDSPSFACPAFDEPAREKASSGDAAPAADAPAGDVSRSGSAGAGEDATADAQDGASSAGQDGGAGGASPGSSSQAPE